MPRHNGSRRGRPAQRRQIRVRTERRADIDFAALARAVLEQAARDDQAKRVGLKPVDPPAKKPGHAGGSTEEK